MISHRFFVFLLGLLLFFLLIACFNLPVLYDNSMLRCTIFIICIVLFLTFLVVDNVKIKSCIIRPFILFVCSYFIVFFQRYFDLALNIIDINNSVFIDVNLINKSLIISLMGFVSFLIGYYLKSTKSTKSTFTKELIRYYYKIDLLRFFFVLATILFFFFNAEDLLFGLYSQEELEKSAGTISNYTSIFYIVSYFSLLSMSVSNCLVLHKTKMKDFVDEFGLLSLLCVIAYCLVLLLAGSRSNVIICLFSFVFSVLYITQIKVRFWQVFVCILLFSYVMTFVGLTRTLDNVSINDKVNAIKDVDLQKGSILPTTVELSGSLKTFNASLDYVPKQHDYLYCNFHIRNIISAIPFSSLVTRHVYDNHWKYSSSAFFVTYILQGENYNFGNGSSINADLYLSYGVFGVICGLFILGILIRKIEEKFFLSICPNLINIIFYLYFVGYSFPYCRNGFLDPLNYLIFILLFVLVYNFLVKYKKINVSRII